MAISKVKQNCFNILIKAGKFESATLISLCMSVEGADMIYLPNARQRLEAHISNHQFAGYLSALEKKGLYKPTSDKFFGQLVGSDI